MKWIILLADARICGGVNVIFEHIAYAHSQGVEVTVVSSKKLSAVDMQWHYAADCAEYRTYEECSGVFYDVAIVTGWNTAYEVYQIQARKYVYFVQAVESRFHKNQNTMGAKLAEMTYVLPFQYVTEASWIRKYLSDMYGWQAELIQNGINKNVFHDKVRPYVARQKGKLRVLVEGNVESWRKNVEDTVKVCRQSEADEIWLLTSSDIRMYEGVDRVFSKIPMRDVPRIYASCDVLVKLSLVEGMFGPPLEMFHCGGTAITYDIEGAEEYIVHGYNALVAPKDDLEIVLSYINELKRNSEELSILKRNAKNTAQKWRGWEYASEEFYEKISGLPEADEKDKRMLMLAAKAYEGWFHLQSEEYEKIVSVSAMKEIVHRLFTENLDAVIYGAGYAAEKTVAELSEHGIVVSGVAVTSLSDNPNALLGHEVHEITHYIYEKEKYLIIIATTKYKDEILQKVRQLDFPNAICI